MARNSAEAMAADSLRCIYEDATEEELLRGGRFMIRYVIDPETYADTLTDGRTFRSRLQREMFGGSDGSVHDGKCSVSGEEAENLFHNLQYQDSDL